MQRNTNTVSVCKPNIPLIHNRSRRTDPSMPFSCIAYAVRNRVDEAASLPEDSLTVTVVGERLMFLLERGCRELSVNKQIC
jgi:hypothetical protein